MVHAIAATLILSSTPLDLTEWNRDRINTNRGGMITLGVWAVGNMAVGGIGFAIETDQRGQYLHLGNLIWNSVNLGLAVVGLLTTIGDDPSKLNAKDSLLASERMEKIFFINAGIDAGYMAFAAFVWQRGEATGDPRLVGFGQALLIQGAFLALFDTTMAILNLRLTDRLTDSLSITIAPGAISGRF